MRLGVLDVGSNTVHLLVVDAHRGGRPAAAASFKRELPFATLVASDGRITRSGEERLTDVVAEAVRASEGAGVEDLMAFATSALREAPNGPDVVGRVGDAAGVVLDVMDGKDEARLTFLAVRRWFGWSAGRLLVADIGGGSLELAEGDHEEPDVAVSLALGAGRMHREFLAPHDPARPSDVAALRSYVRARLDGMSFAPDLAVATSKTFRTLARIAGEKGRLRRSVAVALVERLRETTIADRRTLPGVSEARAPQLLAGAIVAEQVMEVLGIESFTLCPWALREGVILRHLDWFSES